MERIAVLIDNGYFKKVQESFGVRIDYLKFSNILIGSNNFRFRNYVYDCPPYQSNPPTPDQIKRKSGFDSFKYNITRLPNFEFRLGRLQLMRNEDGNILYKKDGTPELKQKGVDMALGIDAVKLSSKSAVNKIILVAGDSDFVPAVIAAKQEGVLVTLYYSNLNYIHHSLYECCDDRIEITKNLLMKSKF